MSATASRPVGARRLIARKPVAAFLAEAALQGGDHGMRRNFGPASLTLLGVGTIIGLGVYVVTGQIAAEQAGPAIVLSFLIAGFACGCAALCYAELAAMIPVAGGSAYAYTHVSLGELAAWLVAWAVVAEYLFSIAAVGSGWSAYAQAALASLNLHLPAALASAPIRLEASGIGPSGTWFDLPAAMLVIGAGSVVLAGTRSLAWVNTLIVTIKLSAVLLVIIFGLAHANPANWSPFVPPVQIVSGVPHYGWHGVVAGAGMIFFAYLGFDTVSTAGREARNPQRTLPIAILGSVGICTILYVAVSLALTGLVPYRELGVAAPVNVALTAGGPSLAWLKPVVTASAVIGLASAALALIYGLSRILYATAADGLLPLAFSRLSWRARVPALGIVVATGCGALLAGLLPVMLLGELISVGTLIAFCVVCGTLAYLRVDQPDVPRGFRVPAWPFVSLVGLGSCLYLLINIGIGAQIRIGIWMAIGVAIYFAVGFRSPHGWSMTGESEPHAD